MNVLLISTYELGRQPFGLASPAAWLRRAGAQVTCLDLSREKLCEKATRDADFIAFYVPMHTATRLAVAALARIRQLNSRAHLCFYGLYAPANEGYLRSLGAATILGGEFEAGLVSAVERSCRGAGPQTEPVVSLARLEFITPDRTALEPLARYAHLNTPDGKRHVVGYTEASRGCKHLCRHCPIVPVYNSHFRVVPQEIVLEDIRQQVAAGAEHITFGDPDFFNGPKHALEIVRALHREFPSLTYDVTIKIEHLLRHAGQLKTLRDTGCLFVTSAAESVDDRILERLEKGHTTADFVAVVEIFREIGLGLSPTFVAFTPWTTRAGYREFLGRLAQLRLNDQVAPVQLAIRLLVPRRSRLLELPEIRETIGPFDEAALVYPWANIDSRVDELCAKIQEIIARSEKLGLSRQEIFWRVWSLASEDEGLSLDPIVDPALVGRAAVPYLNEPWYC